MPVRGFVRCPGGASDACTDRTRVLCAGPGGDAAQAAATPLRRQRREQFHDPGPGIHQHLGHDRGQAVRGVPVVDQGLRPPQPEPDRLFVPPDGGDLSLQPEDVVRAPAGLPRVGEPLDAGQREALFLQAGDQVQARQVPCP
jgi:hypothetical protein